MLTTIPKQGTQAWDEFVRKATKDPGSIEAKALRQMMADSQQQVQSQFREMLQQMIDLVPGQLFRDIARFHDKFQLLPTEDPGHELPEDLLKFRMKFLYEELTEYCEAVGFGIQDDMVLKLVDPKFDAEKAFDALIDLVYVALGTAYLHRFPFNDGWARVQEANMKKVRAESADDERSVRKHAADVVKPEGWEPAILKDLL